MGGFFGKKNNMDAKYIYENIGIAQHYLDTFHMLVSRETLCMDMCFLPPFRWKAFYAQIFGKNGGFRAHCAFTRYADHTGAESFSQSFVTAEKADVLSHKKGDVICRITDIDRAMVNMLTEQAEAFQPAPAEEEGVVLDGIYAAVRLYENGSVTKEIIITPRQKDTAVTESMIAFSKLI